MYRLAAYDRQGHFLFSEGPLWGASLLAELEMFARTENEDSKYVWKVERV